MEWYKYLRVRSSAEGGIECEVKHKLLEEDAMQVAFREVKAKKALYEGI